MKTKAFQDDKYEQKYKGRRLIECVQGLMKRCTVGVYGSYWEKEKI